MSARAIDFAGLGARDDVLVRLLHDAEAHPYRNVEKEERKLSDVLHRQARTTARDHSGAFDVRQKVGHMLIVGERVPRDARINGDAREP